MIEKGTLQKYHQHNFERLRVKYQNDIKVHSQELDPIGNLLQHHQFVCT